jgi:hypothetical protein
MSGTGRPAGQSRPQLVDERSPPQLRLDNRGISTRLSRIRSQPPHHPEPRTNP